MHLKILSAKKRPFCPGRDELNMYVKVFLCLAHIYREPNIHLLLEILYNNTNQQQKNGEISQYSISNIHTLCIKKTQQTFGLIQKQYSVAS